MSKYEFPPPRYIIFDSNDNLPPYFNMHFPVVEKYDSRIKNRNNSRDLRSYDSALGSSLSAGLGGGVGAAVGGPLGGALGAGAGSLLYSAITPEKETTNQVLGRAGLAALGGGIGGTLGPVGGAVGGGLGGLAGYELTK